MDSLGKLIGMEVRVMAMRRGMSVSALARALGLPQTYVARRVDGRAAFTPDELKRVAAALAVTVADLLPPEAHEVRPVGTVADLAALDVNALEKIAAALGVTVASLMEQRESAASGAGSGTPPPRYRPEEEDPAGSTDSPCYRGSPQGHSRYGRSDDALPAADQAKSVTSLTGRSADSQRPPSGPRAGVAGRATGPAPRRPRVHSRLVGSGS